MIMEFISGSLILLFTYAAFSKLFDLEAFSGDLHNQPIPRWLASFLIRVLLPLEILIACCLLFQRTKKIGLYASLGLLSVFSVYIVAVLLHFFPRTPCSCGGLFKHLSWQEQLWVNLGFMALSLTGILVEARKQEKSINKRNSIIHH